MVAPNSNRCLGHLTPYLARKSLFREVPMSHLFIGIDVAKRTLDFAVRPAGPCWTLAPDPAAFPGLVAQLRQLGPTRIVLEATGGLETPPSQRRGCPWRWSIRGWPATLPKPADGLPKLTAWRHRLWCLGLGPCLLSGPERARSWAKRAACKDHPCLPSFASPKFLQLFFYALQGLGFLCSL